MQKSDSQTWLQHDKFAEELLARELQQHGVSAMQALMRHTQADFHACLEANTWTSRPKSRHSRRSVHKDPLQSFIAQLEDARFSQQFFTSLCSILEEETNVSLANENIRQKYVLDILKENPQLHARFLESLHHSGDLSFVPEIHWKVDRLHQNIIPD